MRIARCPARGCHYPNAVQIDGNAVRLKIRHFPGARSARSQPLDDLARMWAVDYFAFFGVTPRLSDAVRQLWTPTRLESTQDLRKTNTNPELADLTQAVLDALG